MPNDNINITPDMLKNLSNMLKNTNGNLNFEDFVSNLGKDSSFDSSKSSSNGENIDFETVLKMKNIVEKLNKKDDPRTNLLYSLKPYLNKNRQQKLDKYVNILRISDVASLFKDQKKGDEN